MMNNLKIRDIQAIIAERRLKKLDSSLYNILPNTYKRRNKRGLFNPLGSFIKAITGNLDQEDLTDIESSIKKLDNGQYELIDKYNDQIKINNQLIENNILLTEHINNLTIKMNEWIKSASQASKNLTEGTFLNQLFLQLYDQIDIVQDQIDEVHEILTFSKINVISRHILDNQEMEYVTTEFDKDNLKINSEEQIYSLLKIKAFYNNTDLVIIIEIPQFTNENFNTYKILTYPVNNQIINQPYNFLLLNPNNYMIINNLCPTIEQTFICEKQQIYPITGHCIPELLNNQNTSCTTQYMEPAEEIKQIDDGYLYISSPEGLSITSTCNLKQARVKGIKLIKYSQCTIYANNKRFSNTKTHRKQKLALIQPLDNININITIQESIDVPLLTEQTIHKLDGINNKSKFIQIYQHSTVAFTITAILIIILIILFIHRKNKQIFNKSLLPKLVTTHRDGKEVEDNFSLPREELCVITPQSDSDKQQQHKFRRTTTY